MQQQKQDSPCFVWDLTIPKDRISVDDLKLRFKTMCQKVGLPD